MIATRRLSQLARFVLGWFLLWLGVAMAGPVLDPAPAMQMICSGGTLKPLALDDGQPDSQPRLDCPLCAAGDAPPPRATALVAGPLPLGRALQSIPSARIAALTAAPLPARGPPLA